MLDRLARLFGTPARALRPRPPHLPALADHHAGGYPLAPLSPNQLDHYAQSAWVYVAVTRIAEAGALVPLHVYQLDGERLLEVVRHPLERLLDNPNPFTSRFELLEQTLGYLELTGNAYWYLTGDRDGAPAEIWCLRPDRVAIVPDPERYIRGYLYHLDGQAIPLDAAEVIHFKRWHPANDYYGLSALASARLAVESDRAMTAWNRTTFGHDHGVPAGIVTVPEHVSDADFERVKREWLSSYGSGQRRTAFLRGGSITWQGIGLSHHDLDFLQGRKAHRDEILSIFGVPVALISENATEANAKVAERLFIERTLYPRLVRLAQKITQELLPFYPGECVALFEDIRPTDQQARLAELRASADLLTVDERRERYFHLKPLLRPLATPAPLPAPTPAKSDPDPAPPAESPADLRYAELAQWERFALKRAGRARRGRGFVPRHLPPSVAFELSARLMSAHTPHAIRDAFRKVRATLR